jgi:hypothetical protein
MLIAISPAALGRQMPVVLANAHFGAQIRALSGSTQAQRMGNSGGTRIYLPQTSLKAHPAPQTSTRIATGTSRLQDAVLGSTD